MCCNTRLSTQSTSIAEGLCGTVAIRMRIKVVRLSAVTEEMEVVPGTSVDDLLHDAAGSRVFSAEGAELAQSEQRLRLVAAEADRLGLGGEQAR